MNIGELKKKLEAAWSDGGIDHPTINKLLDEVDIKSLSVPEMADIANSLPTISAIELIKQKLFELSGGKVDGSFKEFTQQYPELTCRIKKDTVDVFAEYCKSHDPNPDPKYTVDKKYHSVKETYVNPNRLNLKSESIEEFLARGGKVTKVDAKGPKVSRPRSNSPKEEIDMNALPAALKIKYGVR